MNDLEYKKLKTDIERAINKLNELQDVYYGETGQRYVPPIRLAPVNQVDTDVCATCTIGDVVDEKQFRLVCIERQKNSAQR